MAERRHEPDLDQLNGYADYINEITQTLNAMADGDIHSSSCDYTGEFKKIKDAFTALSERWAQR